MLQHPMVTVSWTISGLEAAIRNLGDGPAEQRVRRQFHQLIVALEHDTRSGILTPPAGSKTFGTRPHV